MTRQITNIRDLVNPDIVKRLYGQYYIQDITPGKWISSHWKKFGAKIDVQIDQSGELKALKGYGFGDLEKPHFLSKILKYLCNFSYFITSPHKKDLVFLSKKARPNLKKIESFLSYDCFRQLCSLCTIRQHFNFGEKESFDILVIGDGYGFLSSVLKSVYPKSRITLIDIGKVLLFQARNLQVIHPEASHRLFNGTGNIEESDFLYVPAEKSQEIRNKKYRLIINIASFQEMNYETIDTYFNLLRSNAAKDNLFYCCNRQRKVLFEDEVIEFSKYPWHFEDNHLVDEICPFYRYYFSARFPFIRKFDGPIRHRVTNLKIREQA